MKVACTDEDAVPRGWAYVLAPSEALGLLRASRAWRGTVLVQFKVIVPPDKLPLPKELRLLRDVCYVLCQAMITQKKRRVGSRYYRCVTWFAVPTAIAKAVRQKLGAYKLGGLREWLAQPCPKNTEVHTVGRFVMYDAACHGIVSCDVSRAIRNETDLL